MQRLRIHPPQPRQLIGIDPVILALAPLRSFHLPRIRHQHFVPVDRATTSRTHAECVPTSTTTRAAFQPLEKFRKSCLRRPQLSLRQLLSVQTQNAVVAPLVAQIHAYASDGPGWGEAHLADPLLRHSLLPTFFGSSFSSSLATSSASTSFVSRRTGPRDFVCFDGCSFFFPELLSFFLGRSPYPL